jgi:MFS family permease
LRFFYGWWLVGFAWILYGFGAAPGYYSWSFFSPEIIDELDLTRAQTGAVFGLFTFMFNSIAPVTGLAIARWGTRRVMVVGNLFTAPVAGFSAVPARCGSASFISAFSWVPGSA